MANITISVPKELKSRMEEADFINWSAVARSAIQQKLAVFEKLSELTQESSLTDKDVLELSKKIKRGMAKRHELRN
jgi:hypothetical protein